MLSFTVRVQFELEHSEKIREHLRVLTLASRQEPGCVTYVAHFVEDDATTILIYEQYVDQAALDFHRGTPHYLQEGTNGFFPFLTDRKAERLLAIC